MAGDGAFQVEGVVTEALPNGTYRVALANGHCLLAFVPGPAKRTAGRWTPGERVKLQLTPYDLSTGRILTRWNEI